MVSFAPFGIKDLIFIELLITKIALQVFNASLWVRIKTLIKESYSEVEIFWICNKHINGVFSTKLTAYRTSIEDIMFVHTPREAHAFVDSLAK